LGFAIKLSAISFELSALEVAEGCVLKARSKLSLLAKKSLQEMLKAYSKFEETEST
jgi:hypothetical protein